MKMSNVLTRTMINGSAGLYPPLRSTGKRTGKRRKISPPKRRTATKTKRSGKSRKPARLVKGSRAAKAYMAKIRRKRRK